MSKHDSDANVVLLPCVIALRRWTMCTCPECQLALLKTCASAAC